MCPKCKQPLPDVLTRDADLTPNDLARMCQYQNACPYVACDDVACQAKKRPVTAIEWETAATHWQAHQLDYGCSHGR